MSRSKDNSIVVVISNLTKTEAQDLKTALIEKADRIAPNCRRNASTGTGENIYRAISQYEARRIADKGGR